VGLAGDRQFRPEKVWAYEIGYRAQPVARLSWSISAFYNDYSDLRTIEPAAGGGFFPLHWGNLMAGDTYGLEIWGNYQLTDWWRLSPGFSSVHKRLHFEPGASGILGVAQAGDDPSGHALLNSSMKLGRDVTLDASLRYVAALPDPALPSYYDMSARIGWRACRNLQLSLSGTNLLNARHYELPATFGAEQLTRGVLVQGEWSF
jgi:iron complex outermembrane receptor protein